MKIKENYNHTIYACFGGSTTQAIVNNFVPLLFVTFSTQFSISLDKISLLVLFNFVTQLFVDICAPKIADKIGVRACVVASQAFVAAGLIGLSIFPTILPDPFIGLIIAVVLYACGGGLVEVFVSPIVNACPSKHKQATMSLLHSFYCWGQVFVVLVSTIFFSVFQITNWYILSLLWAILPLLDAIYLSRVPIPPLTEEGQSGIGIKELLHSRVFLLAILAMICSGACEMAMGQWASAFAEIGLKVSKTLGDLAGPCMFAVLMGISRVLHAKIAHKTELRKIMTGSGIICILGYILSAFSSWAIAGLIGCALCGLGVGIMWPGILSITAERIPKGGATMFAALALAGDIGCISGPTIVGFLANALSGDLKAGLAVAICFPVLLTISILFLTKKIKSN